MEYREMLSNVPHSYEDFVVDVSGWMEQNETIKDAVFKQIGDHPDSDSGDILKVVCDILGMKGPLKIIDDEPKDEPTEEKKAHTRKGINVAMF